MADYASLPLMHCFDIVAKKVVVLGWRWGGCVRWKLQQKVLLFSDGWDGSSRRRNATTIPADFKNKLSRAAAATSHSLSISIEGAEPERFQMRECVIVWKFMDQFSNMICQMVAYDPLSSYQITFAKLSTSRK